jgi:hypothetical protein
MFRIAMASVIRYRETHAKAAAPVDGHIGNSVMPQFGGPLAGHYGCEAGAGSVRAWCGPQCARLHSLRKKAAQEKPL